jgi:signal transduction histidine kinase
MRMRSVFGKIFAQGLWMPAAVLFMGSLSIGLMIWTDRINEKQRVDYVVQGALMDVQIHTSVFHLWLEEFIGGNPDVDIKSTWKEFERSVGLIEAILEGGETDHGVLLEPLKNPRSRAQAEGIKASLMDLKEVAQERLRAPELSGITSGLNRRFDIIFEEVLTRTAALEKVVEARRVVNQTNAKNLFAGILSVWTIIVIVVVSGLLTREVRRKKSEKELLSAHNLLKTQAGELEGRTVELLTLNEQLNLEISERKQADEEIVRLNSDLAARAIELEGVNRDLEAFNYTVAHDLRKPLTVVIGYCQAIQEICGGKLDKACKDFLLEAQDGTWRMSRLIDTLLNFSRITHSELLREPVNLSVIAKEVAAELKAAEPARRVSIMIAEGLSATGDGNLLRVVLDNLLGNAWKYTAAKEEAVIEFGVAETGSGPAFFVRDNGAGFARDDVDKIFLPFQRLPEADEFGGFGIGLATVDRIIGRHGGRLWSDGEPGKGATFYFTLP